MKSFFATAIFLVSFSVHAAEVCENTWDQIDDDVIVGMAENGKLGVCGAWYNSKTDTWDVRLNGVETNVGRNKSIPEAARLLRGFLKTNACVR